MFYQKVNTNFLNDKKENIKIILKKENRGNILKDIDKELETKQNGLKKELGKLLDDINNNLFNIYEEGKKEIEEFSEGKIHLELKNKFNDFLLSSMEIKIAVII